MRVQNSVFPSPLEARLSGESSRCRRYTPTLPLREGRSAKRFGEGLREVCPTECHCTAHDPNNPTPSGKATSSAHTPPRKISPRPFAVAPGPPRFFDPRTLSLLDPQGEGGLFCCSTEFPKSESSIHSTSRNSFHTKKFPHFLQFFPGQPCHEGGRKKAS